MQIKFRHIALKNFCGAEDVSFDFGEEKTWITGRNGSGKSTIKNAIYWVLFGKLADGSSAKDIQPHDENGIGIDHLDTSVALTMDFDGKEIKLEKVQKQKWVKHHGEVEKTFEGTTTEYSINDIPKSAKAVKDYIGEYVNLDDLYNVLSPSAFFSMDGTKRRKILMNLAEDATDEAIIAQNPQFEELRKDLKDGTCDELLIRSRKVIKDLEKEIESIEPKIKGMELSKQDVEYGNLHEELAELKEKAERLEKTEEETSHATETTDAIKNEIMTLTFDLNEIVRKANEALIAQRKNAQAQYGDAVTKASHLADELGYTERCMEKKESEIKRTQEEMTALANEWRKINGTKFDEKNLVCSLCGQPLPQDDQEKLKADFEENKANRLNAINEKGNDLKKAVTKMTEELEAFKQLYETYTGQAKQADEEVEKADANMSRLPKEADLSESEEYKKLKEQIDGLETKLATLDDPTPLLEKIKVEKQELKAEIEKVSATIERNHITEENNKAVDSKIAELKATRLPLSQKVIDENRKIELLQEFSRKKLEKVAESVNSHFKVIKFKLFRTLVNGATEECCIPLVGGTSYDSTLNTGAKILANIDVCNSFQQIYGVKAPILADDIESLDSDKIPTVGSQMILLKRTDGEFTVA